MVPHAIASSIVVCFEWCIDYATITSVYDMHVLHLLKVFHLRLWDLKSTCPVFCFHDMVSFSNAYTAWKLNHKESWALGVWLVDQWSMNLSCKTLCYIRQRRQVSWRRSIEENCMMLGLISQSPWTNWKSGHLLACFLPMPHDAMAVASYFTWRWVTGSLQVPVGV